jgi:predicted phosphohydrolase
MPFLQSLLLSDIHTEHMTNEEIDYISEKLFGDGILSKVDMVFLCGDIGTIKEKNKLIKFLSIVSSLANLIFWVPGNHEYRGSIFPIKEFEKIAKKSFVKGKIILLNKKKILLHSINEDRHFVIIGATLWSDLSSFNKNFHMRDTHMTLEERKKLHTEDKNFIMENLKNEKNKNIIVLTHHPPYIKISKSNLNSESEPNNDDNNLTHYYGNNDENLNLIIKNALFWCHGHLHEQNKLNIEGTTMFINSFGYKHEDLYIKRMIIAF